MTTSNASSEIRALIRELKDATEMVQRYQKKRGGVDKLMLDQFRQRQQRVAKELLVAIVQSDLSLKNTEQAVRSIFAFLKKHGREELISNDLRTNLDEVSKTLRV